MAKLFSRQVFVSLVYCTRASSRVACTLNSQYLSENRARSGVCTLSTTVSKRDISTGLTRLQTEDKNNQSKVTVGKRVLHIFHWLRGSYTHKMSLSRRSLLLYELYIDEVDYEAFFKVCRLPDSLQSWFLVAQLHLWFCLTRLKREGKDGKFLIKQLVQFFWDDVEERMRVLGVHSGKVKSESLQELSGQFRGLILGYDEGLLSSDKKLAAAIWRVFVCDKQQTDPVMLAVMVEYIREQVKHMDNLSLLKLTDKRTLTVALP